jgi:3-isopropylmalate/(R)-2-methylmalate dehydratase large subunit
MDYPATLYEKLWTAHIVKDYGDGEALLYVDRHILHEVSTPVSFKTMEGAGRSLRRPDAHLAVADHAVPTDARGGMIANQLARAQVARLEQNVVRHNVEYLALDSNQQGIVHVVGPELGFSLPGAVLVCGDSHTSTHGALGALAFGIGASECETVMSTQCVRQRRAKTMCVRLTGERQPYVSSKDIALAVIAQVGANGAAGHCIEYCGSVIDAMSMTERMTLCNMSIEAGARMGLIAPDETTFEWVRGKPMAPKGATFDQAVNYWRTLKSDEGAVYDSTLQIDVTGLAPHVTWGTSPEESIQIGGVIPDPERIDDAVQRARMTKALKYMGLEAGDRLAGTKINTVFIGSCTNGRLEDLRIAAYVLKGRKVAQGIRAIVVPGSGAVRQAAEREGIDRIFIEAGFEWRYAGCSMCVAMNGDMLQPEERCASTSNRNFEGRQGRRGRTHLMSPAMAAAASVTGTLCDVSRLDAVEETS